MNTAEHLRHWEFFSHFTDEQLDRLGEGVPLQAHGVEDMVFKSGEDGQTAFLVDSGKIQIQRQTAYGLYTLAHLGEGEIFGELSFIDGGVRSGDAQVLAEAQLLAFDPERLKFLLEADQQITVALYWSFWKSLARKLRVTNDNLTQFFSEAGRPSSSSQLRSRRVSNDFRIDLEAKRQLFQEQKLSNLEIRFLTTLSQEQKVPPGEVIFHEGDAGDQMYIVLDGRVMISKYIPGGGEEALAFLERGDYFGEMALIDNQPRSADAKADDGGAVLLAIPREVVEGILDIHKVSSLRLLKLLSNLIAKRLRELNEKLLTWFIFSGGGGGNL